MGDTAERAGGAGAGVDLRPFVPRVSLEWLRDDPEARHRRVEASLVFVDISGFTAMSERLARQGRIGAEEVTDLLNQTFSQLLAVSYEDGGSLLKFGGDALLLFFDGPDHTARAVRAAWGMRTRLRELQPLQSSAGQVRLRMSIGVHTGTTDLFLVGAGHRELILVGPVPSTTVRLESAAGAGQIMVSQAVVDALGPRIATTPSTPGALLRSPPDDPPSHPTTAPADVPVGAARDLLSEQVWRRMEEGAPQAEHRPCVVGFVKLTGVDEHLAEHGPFRTAAALEQVVDAVVDAAQPHDVCLLSTDVDADGVKLILTAGVPTSQEFDGERMLRAVRDLVDRDLPFECKVGVHHGPVFAGVVGPPFRLTYTIIGDAVNLAARLMGHAEPGEIVATGEVLNRSHALFAIRELPPFEVKGKKRPVLAYLVGSITSARARRPRSRFRLVGRQAELRGMVAIAQDAYDRGGRVVQITGPPGIGKSRLIDEVHERLPEIPLFLVACNQHDTATPYHVIGTLLRSLLNLPAGSRNDDLARVVGAVAPDQERSLPLLGDVLGIDVPDNAATRELTAGFRAERAAAAACALLDAALDEPVSIAVEDLHWIDHESHTVLRTLVGTLLPTRRWLVLVTTRRRTTLDPSGERGEEVIELEPLTQSDARELVYAGVEEGLVSLDRGQELLDRAGGNPFFLQELLSAGTEGELPDSVDALIQTQLDQLPLTDRELLATASVLGVEIDVELLGATAGIRADDQRATFARLDAFLEPTAPDVFRFKHALVHQAAYSRLPFRRRRQLHLQAAAVLEAREERRPDLLALHTYHARDWERARAYALQAAETASSRFANLTAAEQYRHAIESGRYVRELSAEEAATTWERLGDVLMLASSYEEAVDAYQRARRLAPADRQVRLCGQIGQLRERQGRYSDALRWFSRALKIDGSVAGTTGRMLVESALVRIRQGRPHDAIALAVAAEAAGGDVQTQARAAYTKAWAAMLLGEDAPDDRRRTLELFEEVGDLIGQGLAYNIISISAYYRGDWQEATVAYEHAATLRRRVGDEVAAATAAGNLGELLGDQGHFERARELLEECRTVCGAAGFQSSRLFAVMTLGRLDARLGRYAEAEPQLKEALDGLETIRMPHLVFDARRYLAELALFRGYHDAALDSADILAESASLGTTGLRSVGQRVRTCVHIERSDADAAHAAATTLFATLDDDARDFDTALCLVAVAHAFEMAADIRAPAIRRRAEQALARLGVVVPGELLVFGPTSPRTGPPVTTHRSPRAPDYLPLTSK